MELLRNLQYHPLLFLDNLEVLHKFLCIVKISSPVILQMWESKSGTGADPRPFLTWWSLIYTLLSATLPLNVRIILSDPLFDGSSFYVACVCNHCHQTNQNRRSMIGLTSHISCVYDAFSSYRISFSSITSLRMMVLGLGHLVCAIFHFPLKILLVVSVKLFQLVMSVE